MANHGALILSKVKSVYVGNIFSVQSNEELENGFIGHLGGYKDGQREIRNFEKPTAESLKTRGIVLIGNSEINVDESSMVNNALQYYKIDANVPARAYEIQARDVIEVANIVTPLDSKTGVVKDNYVIPINGSYKLVESATLPAATDCAFVGKILGKRTIGMQTVVGANPNVVSSVLEFVEIEVIRNLNA